MENPFFSVIITTYNRPDKLIEAVDSVLNQTFQDFELIIVNDGSTASYDEVIKHLDGNSKVKFFHKINEERSVARNYGIERAIGKWICFLDDDDIYYSNHLEVRFKNIKEASSDHVFFYSPCFKRMPNGILQKDTIPLYHGVDILVYTGFHISTVCITAKVAKNHHFNRDLNYYEDFEYWLRLFVLEKLETKLINEHTTEYILHDSNTVSDWSSKIFRNKLKTFIFIKNNYSNYLPKFFITNKLYEISLGLSDCYSKEKNKKLGLKFLLKAICYKRDLNGIKHILGVLKNLMRG